MPVCNGPQTLEMLRAEPEFAGISVIFLSGRRERECMVQVIPLKPAGYLVEGTTPEEIRREVDQFFKKKRK